MIGNLNIADSLVILGYFVVTLLMVGYHFRDKDQNSLDYFLANRNLGWIAVGMSIFATNISSEHIVGLAGAGASRGLAVGQFEWFAIFILLLLGWFIAPLMLKMGIFTVPQMFEMRFDRRSRLYLTYVSIIAYIITKLSLTIFAGGMLLRHVLGWDLFTSAVVMVLLTGIYTVTGGMVSVVRTQIFQGIVIIAGSLILTLYGLHEVGGISGLTEKLPHDYFVLFKPATDPDFPWTGILFGAPVIAIWYWCIDQYIVQRILSAKSIEDARRGSIFSAFLKILPVFIFVVPGLIAVALYPEVRGDDAFPFLVTSSLLPSGVKGLVVAGLIAALMSSLASVFHSTATLYTFDIYKPKHPEASDRKLVLVGRLAATVTVIFAILWVPLIKVISSGVYVYLQSIQAIIAPPIAAVFLLGLFWQGANAQGAFVTLVSGGLIGLVRLFAEILVLNGIVANPALEYLAGINYLHFAIFLFTISTLTMVAVSRFHERNNNSIGVNLDHYGVHVGLDVMKQSGVTLRKLNVKKGEIILFVFLLIGAVAFWTILA